MAFGSSSSEESPQISNSDPEPTRKLHRCQLQGCNARFSRPWRLEAHVRVHLGERPFPCLESGCGKSYTTQSHLKRHMVTTHAPSQAPQSFKCTYEGCSAVFKTRQNQEKHYRRTHVMRTCPICRKVFSKASKLKAHVAGHSGNAVHRCETCGITFPEEDQLNRHLRSHKIHLCPHRRCFMAFETWTSVRKHLKTHPPDYVCFYCKKPYRVRKYLKAHIWKHEQSVPLRRQSVLKEFECPDCHKMLKGKASLNRHRELMHNRVVVRKKPKTGSERAPRKDKGEPRRAMATVLSSVLVTPDVESQILKGYPILELPHSVELCQNL